ncbi:MAG: hypothetical protein ACRDTA_21440 [Pseudonocardiaceae bacterium]
MTEAAWRGTGCGSYRVVHCRWWRPRPRGMDRRVDIDLARIGAAKLWTGSRALPDAT